MDGCMDKWAKVENEVCVGTVGELIPHGMENEGSIVVELLNE